MKAYVLMHVRPGSVIEVVRNLRRVSGVLEANMTFGPYDAVAVVESRDVNHLGMLVASEIQPIPGILDTMTCLVVEPA
jgi:DNA-binding Lrp family transcriptional regulator